MKKTINQRQLENMIAECVGQVLVESRQPRLQKTARKVMNEAQLNRYIQNIINEELENEGFWGKAKGAVQGLGKAVSGEWNKAKRGIMQNGLSNEYQGQSFGDRMRAAGNNIRRNAEAGDKNQDMQNFIGQVEKMKRSGLLPQQASAAADQFIKSLQMSMQGRNGGLQTAYNKAYGE